MTILEANDLHKQYALGLHGVKALDGVNLQVEPGEFVAIMGPSGSGKSTLLHLLGGLDQPSSGEIFLDGKNISILPDRESTLIRRRSIGFVFQFFNLLPTLSAEENILLPLIIDGKNTKDYQDRLNSLLIRVGLVDRRHHKPDQLSGGEQQRVALARALMTNPAILLADEPTGNLDTRNGSEVMKLLEDTSRELNQTIIMVTHDPKAAAYADRIIFLQDGKIISELNFKEEANHNHRLRDIIRNLERLE